MPYMTNFNILGQRSEDKFTLCDTRVRNLETLMVKLDVVVQENVEIDIPWALVDDLFSAQCLLNVLKSIQELKRLQGSLDLKAKIKRKVGEVCYVLVTIRQRDEAEFLLKS